MPDININTIELEIDGAKYSQFKEIMITRSLDSIGGSFEAVIANRLIADVPIKVNDNVVVFVNGVPVLNGYINKSTPSYADSDHSLNISGFDNTIDIVESSINVNSEYNAPISLQQLIKRVLDDNGIDDIEVKDSAGNIQLVKGEIAAAKVGESIFEYVDRIARKKQCLISGTGTGNVVIYRNSGIDIGGAITNIAGDNKNKFIKSASTEYDFSRRFKKIIVRSQGGFGDDVEGSAIDTGARDGRIKVIVSDLVTDTKTAQEMAVWEINKRRSDSAQYSCSFQGFWATKNTIWAPNQIIDVRDDYADIKSKMLLKTVKYVQTEEEGNIASLTFVSPDSYSLELSDPNAKYNKIGDSATL